MQRLLDCFRAIEKTVVTIVEILAVALLVTLFVVVFLGVLDRFILLIGWGWPEEIARFVLVWCAFLAFSLCVNKGLHYKVTYFVDRFLAPRPRAAMEMVVFCLCLVIAAIFGAKGIYLTATSLTQVSPALRLPMAVVYAVIPVSALLISVFLVMQLLNRLESFLGREE